MIRFHCGRCGHRIAIQKRQLASVIVCPDCGAVTHPIAEQVIKRRSSAKPQVAAAPGPPRQICANCGNLIGRLQKLRLWDNRIVCDPCHRKLAGEAAIRVAPITRVVRRIPRTIVDSAEAPTPHLLAMIARPLRGGLFGALVALCVAGATLYGAMSLLQSVAGLVTGLAVGGLTLLVMYMGVRFVISRRIATGVAPGTTLQIADKRAIG